MDNRRSHQSELDQGAEPRVITNWYQSIFLGKPERRFTAAMADGTRSKSTEAQIQELKQAVRQLKQAVEIHGRRSDSDQRFKTWEQTTMTTTSFQEESKIEITQRREHNFEVLTELLRDIARKETLSAATSLDKGVESGLETKNNLNRTPKSDFLTPDDKNQEEVQFHSEQPKPGEEFVKQATESPTSSLSCNLGDSRVMDRLKAIAQGRPTVYQETHATQNSTRDISFSFEIEGVGDPTIAWGISIDSKHPKIFKEFNAEFDVGASTQELVRDLKEHPKVIRNPLVVVESEELDILPEILPDSIKIKVARYVASSMELLDVPIAHQLFGEMPLRGIKINRFSIQSGNTQSYMGDRLTVEAHHRCPYPTIFDPGGSLRLRAVEIGNGRVIDMASTDQFGNNLVMGALLSLHVFKDHLKSMPFDRGRDITTLCVNPEAICVVQTEKHIPAVTLKFDPGGEMAFMLLSCMSCASKETVFTCSWWIKIDASVARGSGLRIIWRSQLAKSAYATGAAIDDHRLLVKVLVFDRGIPKGKKKLLSVYHLNH